MSRLRIREKLDGQFTQIIIVLVSVAVVAFAGHSLLSTRAAAAPPLVGVDTSHWNATLDVTKLKAEGVVYQFMKATQGTTSNDSNFATTRTNAKNGGLIPGAYHFLNVGNGAAQCDHYLDRLNQTGGTSGIMLALDVELQTSTTGPSYQDVKDFLARCQPKTPGRTWVIYTGGWYWGSATQAGYLHNPPAPAGTLLWISIYVGGSGSLNTLLAKVGAQGTSEDPYPSAKLNGWSEYTFRQFTASATVAGTSPIDADVIYHNLDFLKNLAGIPTDTTAPTVSITAPTSGATVVKLQPVTLSAAASDNIGVTKVSFYLDTYLIKTITAPPYTYEWSPLSGNTPGPRTIVASAYDAAGNVGTTTIPITLVDADTTPPTVSITAPAGGSSVAVGTPVAIAATAVDNVAVAKVEFYVDGALKSTATAAPYGYTWPTTGLAAGAHSLAAKAYDAAGNAATSSPVSLTLTAATIIPGDTNGDGRVNAPDLSVLISYDGLNYPAADFNKDGVVGAADLAILLAHWTW